MARAVGGSIGRGGIDIFGVGLFVPRGVVPNVETDVPTGLLAFYDVLPSVEEGFAQGGPFEDAAAASDNEQIVNLEAVDDFEPPEGLDFTQGVLIENAPDNEQIVVVEAADDFEPPEELGLTQNVLIEDVVTFDNEQIVNLEAVDDFEFVEIPDLVQGTLTEDPVVPTDVPSAPLSFFDLLAADTDPLHQPILIEPSAVEPVEEQPPSETVAYSPWRRLNWRYYPKPRKKKKLKEELKALKKELAEAPPPPDTRAEAAEDKRYWQDLLERTERLTAEIETALMQERAEAQMRAWAAMLAQARQLLEQIQEQEEDFEMAAALLLLM